MEPVRQGREEVDALDHATAMEEHERLTLSGLEHFDGLRLNNDLSTLRVTCRSAARGSRADGASEDRGALAFHARARRG